MATIKSGTYRFNDELTFPETSIYQKITFKSFYLVYDTDIYTSITVDVINSKLNYYLYCKNYRRDIPVYAPTNAAQWDNEGWKIISVIKDQEVSEAFYIWFSSNAVKIVAEVSYNSEHVASIPSTNTKATISCTNKVMEGDVALSLYVPEEAPLAVRLRGDYKFKDVLDFSILLTVGNRYIDHVQFSTDGISYYGILCTADALYIAPDLCSGEQPDYIQIYSSSTGWVKEEYKTFCIGEAWYSVLFSNWLAANASITFKLNGETFEAKYGMLWATWIASDYNTDHYTIGYTKELGRNVVKSIDGNVLCTSTGAAVYADSTIDREEEYIIST